MMKTLRRSRPALAGAAACLMAVAGGWSEPQASLAAGRPALTSAADAGAHLNATPVASPSPLPTLASKPVQKKIVAARPARPASVPRTTSTTIMGGGSPSTWPAARAVAPSLAGAYSPNLKTAFITLVNYSDWVGSHPNPTLVKNFMLPTCNVYTYSVNLMRILVERRWHDYPNPTEINYFRVVRKPTPIMASRHQPSLLDGHRAYLGGILDVVIVEKNVPYLNHANKIVGYSGGGGATVIAVTLTQGHSDGRFRIENWHVLKPTGGIAAWERTQGPHA
jgi:hypothetical protein